MESSRGSTQAKVYEDKIVQYYPESRFARIIKDPENFKLRPNETPATRYEAIYQLYLEQQYEKVLEQGEDLMVVFSGTPMVSKVAHLMANAVGRLDGIELWKEQLQSLIDVYPNSEAATQAKSTLSGLAAITETETSEQIFLNYKWIFPVLKENQDQIPVLSAAVTKALQNAGIQHGSLTLEVYDRDFVFLVVNDLGQQPQVELELSEKTPTELFTTVSNKFVALSSQYKDIQLFKSWKTEDKNTNHEE
jgi:outer membrane protein assembly factor BamD (BamD/ComL family)